MLSFRVCLNSTLVLNWVKEKLSSTVEAAASDHKDYEEEVDGHDEMKMRSANLIRLGRDWHCLTSHTLTH